MHTLLMAAKDADHSFVAAWLPAVTSIGIALLALGGVVWSTNRSARATREAESKRAAATIAAEDRRAAAAIEAENLRHANGLKHADAIWSRDTKAAAYFDLLNGLNLASDAVHHIRWFLRNMPASMRSDDDPKFPKYHPVNLKMAADQMDEWNEAFTIASRAGVAIRTIGDPEIARKSRVVSLILQKTITKLWNARQVAMETGDPFDHQRLFQARFDRASKITAEIRQLVRNDLNAPENGDKFVPTIPRRRRKRATTAIATVDPTITG